MIHYTGLECPVCGKTFTDDDEDIVVCPECGAPHHRECYTAHGQCGCADLHGTDRSWDKQHAAAQQEKTCPYCQKSNPEIAVFCSHCGRPLGQSAEQQEHQQHQSPFSGAPAGGFGGRVNNGAPFPVSPEDDFGGVTARDTAKVVRANVPFYMIMFSRIQNQGRSRMNFAALIFGGAWLLYRKQYKRGIIFTILSGGLYALNLVFSLLFTQPMMEEIYQSLGYSTTTNVTNTVLDQIALGVKALSPGAMALFFLPLLFTALRWALHIFLAIKANRWYKDYCVNTVKDVMATATTQLDEEELFKKRGGINTPVAFGIVALYFAASYLLPILL